MRWRSIIASLVLACAIAMGAATPQASAQTSSTTTASKPAATHKKKHHAKRQPSQKAPLPDRISEIQSSLARGGYYQGQPNGKWDSNTVAALQKFQSANGIEANGKLDAPTLQKLGLGSDIAGVSAPKPVPPPNCCSTAPAAPPSSQTSSPASSAAVAENSSGAAPAAKPAAH
jgi:peptidoglycan hydrolase-like protein with peptidoglycan-binding domain